MALKLDQIFILLMAFNLSTSSTKLIHVTINSKIRTRFAITVVEFHVQNSKIANQELPIEIQIPLDAFVTNFTLQSGNKITVGKVEEKSKAMAKYEETALHGHTTSLLEHRNRNIFVSRLMLGPFRKAVIQIVYQEVLKRQYGVYKHAVFVTEDMAKAHSVSIRIEVIERGLIVRKHIPKFRKNMAKKSNKDLLRQKKEREIEVISKVTAKTRSSKETIIYESKKLGELILLYDVQRDTNGNQIEAVDGYFIHFFAPSDLPVGTRHIIFVLDISGSMKGSKYYQVKQAMNVILSDLRRKDWFKILTFNDIVESVGEQVLVPADIEQVEKALISLEAVEPSGYTNIHDALTIAVSSLTGLKADPMLSMIFFLTDGHPSMGVLHDEVILDSVDAHNQQYHYSIHTVAFGTWAKYDLLRKISERNRGVARKLYYLSDTAAQLKGFFDEVARPVMRDIIVRYIPSNLKVTSLVSQNGDLDKTGFLMAGQERVMVGKYRKSHKFETIIHGKTAQSKKVQSSLIVDPSAATLFIQENNEDSGQHTHTSAYTVKGVVEKMWAHLTVQQLLHAIDAGVHVEESKATATLLCLKYNFVTPLTSMIIIPGDKTSASGFQQETIDDSDKSSDDSNSGSGLSVKELLHISKTTKQTTIITEKGSYLESIEQKQDPGTKESMRIAYRIRNTTNKCKNDNLDLLVAVDLSGSPGQSFQSRELCRRVLYWIIANRRCSHQCSSSKNAHTRASLVAFDEKTRGRIFHDFDDNQNPNYLSELLKALKPEDLESTRKKDFYLLTQQVFRYSKPRRKRKVMLFCGLGEVKGYLDILVNSGPLIRRKNVKMYAALPRTSTVGGGSIKKMIAFTGSRRSLFIGLKPGIEKRVADVIC